MPDAVREFLIQQIELMTQGIHRYPIIGRRDAREAVRRAAAEVLDADDSVTNAAPSSYKEKIAKLWTTMLASVEGSEKMVKAITGVAEAVPKLIAAVSGGSPHQPCPRVPRKLSASGRSSPQPDGFTPPHCAQITALAAAPTATPAVA